MGVWNFIQDQVLGMKWLNSLIGAAVSALGVDTAGRIGGSIQFFLYDVVKITVLLGVLFATAVGVPMYADIFGTIPVAEALLGKGAQLGTVLAFMMAVTTLSLPSLIMLRKAVKPKLLALFIAICTIGIVLVGYLFNALQFILV